MVLNLDNYLKTKKTNKMKKLLLAFAILGFVACGPKGEPTPATGDTLEVAPTPAPDTTGGAQVDTNKVDTPAVKP